MTAVLDVVIRNGTVVDGSGAPRRRADVAIEHGRIVAVGEVSASARHTIDASDRVVAPGFVDSHTHHDAGLLWDPSGSPSLQHGVTTVIGGNCGFSIAPLVPESVDDVRRMLARVEGIPLDALEAGPAWDWRNFGDYLDRFEDAIAVNAGFLVGHSTLRFVLFGPRAHESLTTDERERLARAARAAIEQGALGVSSSLATTHHDGDGRPVPSRSADPDELLALAATVRGRNGTFVGINPGVTPFDEPLQDLLVAMARAAGTPVTWNALPVESNRPDVLASARDTAAKARAAGVEVVAQVIPDPRLFHLSMAAGFLFDALPGWAPLFGRPLAEREAALRDAHERARLRDGALHPPDVLRRFFGWERMRFVAASVPEHRQWEGRTLADIAQAWERDLIETFFDLVLANGLDTCFTPEPSGDDAESWRLRGELWREPMMVIGAADTGAHLDSASSFTYTTSLLGGAVRRRGLLSLEEAVHLLADVPARLCQLRDRGRLAPGFAADVVVFDPDRIEPGPLRTVADLPGGARRLYAPGAGIDLVLVNGVEVLRDGAWTGAVPGRVLRSSAR